MKKSETAREGRKEIGGEIESMRRREMNMGE